MKTSFDWIFFDCFNTLIDDFTSDGDESGVKPILCLPVEAGFYATESEFKVDYDKWKRDRWNGNNWGEVDLTDRLKEILTTKDSSRKDEVDALVCRMMSRFELENIRTRCGLRREYARCFKGGVVQLRWALFQISTCVIGHNECS